MLYFSIPDSYYLTPINIKLLKMIKGNPEYFYKDFKIVSAFGCPEGCIWNGGRRNFGMYNLKEIRIMLDIYQRFEVGYRFTFTNNLITKKHLCDHYSNTIAKEGNKIGNSIILNTNLMKKYIKKKYKNYSIVQSITSMLKTLKDVEQKSKKDIVVLPVEFNNKFEIISQLKNQQNIEILVNELCIENCPLKQKHYEEINKSNLLLTDNWWFCPNSTTTDPKVVKSRKHYVNRENLQKYHEIGVKNFKIAGRENPWFAVWNYCEMFVKDEYKTLVQNELLNIKENDWKWEEIK